MPTRNTDPAFVIPERTVAGGYAGAGPQSPQTGRVRRRTGDAPQAQWQRCQARSRVYLTLAEALDDPTTDTADSLYLAVRDCADATGSQACRETIAYLAHGPAMADAALNASYRRTFFATGSRPLMIYESLFRQGRLAGELTRDVASWYRSLGVTPDATILPDHASVELAFLGELVAAEASARAEARTAADYAVVARLRREWRQFLRTHAGMWLPALGDQLAETGVPFFAAVGALLRDFLREEMHGKHDARVNLRTDVRRENCATDAPSVQHRPGRQVPQLADPDVCTLCGLCTGDCPTKALRIVETKGETTLVLDAESCTGCRRCVRICPDQTLKLVENGLVEPLTTGDSAASHVLRRSRRATCPQCGCPTVSQAELQAVMRYLQCDEDMRRRMCLCVECKASL